MAVRRWFVLGSLAVVLAVLVAGCGRDYAADWSTASIPRDTFVTTAGSPSEQAYKDRCLHVNVDYNKGTDFGLYKGKDVYLKGRVYSAGLAGGINSWMLTQHTGLGGAQLVLGPDTAGMAAFVLWPGRIPGVSDKTAGEPDGPVVEVWGECQGGPAWPATIDSVDVRARYVTVH